MDASPIYAALVKAQKEFPAIQRDAVNPHFKSKYTTLETLLRATRESLAQNDLALFHCFDEVDGNRLLITRLVYKDGSHIESRLRLPSTDNMQHLGSATTYARRYSVAALLGVSSDDDDDGQAASPSGNPFKDRQQQRTPPAKTPPAEPPIERAKKKIAGVERCEELTDMFLKCKDNEKLQADHALFRAICIEIGAEIEKRVNAKQWSVEGECTTLMESLKGEIEMIDAIVQTSEVLDG